MLVRARLRKFHVAIGTVGAPRTADVESEASGVVHGPSPTCGRRNSVEVILLDLRAILR